MFGDVKVPAITDRARGVRARARFVLLAVFLFLTGVVVQPALADIYEIKGLGVDATAKDAEQAKIAALKDGQTAAFNLLVRRLAIVDENTKLPQFTSAEIASMLAGITIEEERTSPTRYIAKLTVRFRSEQVKQILQQLKVPFADKQAPKTLLLAVWQAENPILWDNPNPWRKAWDSIDATNSITPIHLPLGDLTDVSLISVDAVLAGDEAKLEALKKRYGGNYLLIARARPAPGNTGLSITIKGTSPVGPVEFTETYPVENGNLPGAAFKAARDFLAALEKRWKSENQDAATIGGNVFAITVPFGSLEEWRTLKAEIEAAEGVRAIDIKTLSASGALVHIRFSGGGQDLAHALGARGLGLTNVGDAWVLERR